MKVREYLVSEAVNKQHIGPFDDKFEKLVKDIVRLTDDNAHTEALLVLAQYLKAKQLVQILMGIQTISNVMGHTPNSLMNFRDEITDNLMSYAKDRLDKSQYQKVISAY